MQGVTRGFGFAAFVALAWFIDTAWQHGKWEAQGDACTCRTHPKRDCRHAIAEQRWYEMGCPAIPDLFHFSHSPQYLRGKKIGKRWRARYDRLRTRLGGLVPPRWKCYRI